MLNINATLLFQIANFLILLVILNFLLFKPIVRILEQREEKIKGTWEKSKQREREADRLLKEYQEKLNEAKLKAQAKRDQLKKEGLEREKEILEKARGETASILKDNQVQIEKEMNRAREALKPQIKILSSKIAQTILGEEIS